MMLDRLKQESSRTTIRELFWGLVFALSLTISIILAMAAGQ